MTFCVVFSINFQNIPEVGQQIQYVVYLAEGQFYAKTKSYQKKRTVAGFCSGQSQKNN